MKNNKLSHMREDGMVNMVDVKDKEVSKRVARAKGHITLRKETIELIAENNLKKGSVLSAAQIAGIMAAKKCPELIPLCHPLLLTKIDVEVRIDLTGVYVESLVSCTGKTGVEMEALTAVSVALLTVYDMCKAVDNSMAIDNTELIEKSKMSSQNQ
ncbi:MAG: cyclic pyranopterin monophosphate synthase MoaC [Rikenellaceae bacterium]